MSPIAAGLDGLLALLLLLALGLGVQLNARLKALRQGQAGFAAAVQELNEAAAKAEAGLAALKIASETAHDGLLARIETARTLTARLEQANAEAARAVPPLPDSQSGAGGVRSPIGVSDTLAAIAALAEGRAGERAGVAPRPKTPADERLATRRSTRPAFDEDLFESAAPERESAGSLRPPRGDR